MADEVESMPLRTAAVELFGVGDWPRTDGLEDSVIDVKAWDALEKTPGQVQLQEPYVGAFDVSPERNGSIAVAGPQPGRPVPGGDPRASAGDGLDGRPDLRDGRAGDLRRRGSVTGSGRRRR